LDYDESWPIFIEEEEGGVKTLKDLCLIAVNHNFKRLKGPLRELPITLQLDVLKTSH
jgi:hypothetical protein